MNRRELLRTMGVGIVGMTAWPFPLGWTAEPKGRKQHVLFFTKSAGYEHSVVHREGGEFSHAERVFTELGEQHDFEVTATKDGRVFDSDLERFDAFLFYTTDDLTKPGNDGTPPMSMTGKQALLDAIQAGKGFLGSHCASDTFHSSGDRHANQPIGERDPFIQMVGGEFVSHGEQQEARLLVTNSHFPGCEELGESFRIKDEWYAMKNFAPDMHVILVQDTEGMTGRDYQRPPFPQTWARQHGKGRVFYTSMGHREDVWTDPTFQQILLGGLAWAVGNVQAEVPTNIDKVTPHADQLPS